MNMRQSAGITPTASSRTRAILRQSGIGIVSKLGAVAATLVATPLMLHLLGSQRLGTWLVLLSVFQWITMFDLGISAGARNEIARAIAVGGEWRVRRAITTGWLYVTLISLALFLGAALALTLTPLPNWLGEHAFNGVDVTTTLWLLLGGACATFALSYIQSVYAAMEKASAFSLYSLLVNTCFLLLLVIALVWSIDQMEWIAVMYIFAMIFGNAWLIVRFRQNFPQYMPCRRAVDNSLRGAILGFGTRLFIIQLAALVIFTTSRVLTSAWLGPESVVVYDAGFKVFSIVTMVHTLIMSTIWSSFTQAYERKEFEWIRQTLKRLALLTLPLIAACVVLAALSPDIIRKWLGVEQVGSTALYSLLATMTILSCWSNIFAYLLNGIGNTRVQMISAIVAGAINIPAAYLFTVALGMGLPGIVLGSVVSLIPFSILGPLAVRKTLGEH